MRVNFDSCLDLIKDKKIKNFVKKALSQAPPEFWIWPASKPGQHPPENLEKSGLVIHSQKAVRAALSLFAFFNLQDDLAKDKIIAALILHDIQKYADDFSFSWNEDVNLFHAQIAKKWLFDLAILEKTPTKFDTLIHIDADIYDILNLVEKHGGFYSQPQPTPAIKLNELLSLHALSHLIVQLADYWASRNWCSFSPDI